MCARFNRNIPRCNFAPFSLLLTIGRTMSFRASALLLHKKDFWECRISPSKSKINRLVKGRLLIDRKDRINSS